MFDAEIERRFAGEPDPAEIVERDETLLSAAIHLGGDRFVRFDGGGYYPVEFLGGDEIYAVLRVPRQAIVGLHV